MTYDTRDEAAVERVANELERRRREVSIRSAETSVSSRRASLQRAEWLRQRTISTRSKRAS
jgi:hypothetical protein